jgi:hypothetical protein
MPAVWDARRLELEDESVVMVPSVTLDSAVPGSGRGLDAAAYVAHRQATEKILWASQVARRRRGR